MPALATIRRKAPEAPPLEFKSFAPSILLTKALPIETDGPGVVEALVAVTNNTDDGGDVIMPGAVHYKREPKIVWSHDLRELVGKVLAREEYLPGDVRLPPDLKLKGLGAIWFRLQFDLEDPEGFKAYRKVVFHQDLGWSIGYEVDPQGAKALPDGRRQLSKIYVWEASPTTFGMNQEARTMSVKSLTQKAVDKLGLTDEKAAALEGFLEIVTSPESKGYPALEGSMEDVQGRVRDAVRQWAAATLGEPGEENDYYASVEGTFDDKVVVSVRYYGGTGTNSTWEFPYALGTDGVDLGEPTEVEVVAAVVPAGTAAAVSTEASVDSVPEAASADLEGLDAKALEAIVDGHLAEVKKGAVLSEANRSALAAAIDALGKIAKAAEPKEDEVKDETKPKAKADEKDAAPVLDTKAAAWLLEAQMALD